MTGPLGEARRGYLEEAERLPQVSTVAVEEWLRARRGGWPFWELEAIGPGLVLEVFNEGSSRRPVLAVAERLARKEWLRGWAEGREGVVLALPPAERGGALRVEWSP